MKRVLLAILGTVAGMTALLGFKTHAPAGTELALPSAGLPQIADSTATAGTPRALAQQGAGSALRPARSGSVSAGSTGSARSHGRSAGAATHAGTPTAPPATPAGGGRGHAGPTVTSSSTAPPAHQVSSPASPPSRSSSSLPPPVHTTAPPPPPVSHTYVGQAVRTRYGTVQVQVTVAGATISNVAFVQLTATDSRSQQINANAGPILLQQTLSAQSARIDGVSGATYTTQGYEQSLQSALDQA